MITTEYNYILSNFDLVWSKPILNCLVKLHAVYHVYTQLSLLLIHWLYYRVFLLHANQINVSIDSFVKVDLQICDMELHITSIKCYGKLSSMKYLVYVIYTTFSGMNPWGYFFSLVTKANVTFKYSSHLIYLFNYFKHHNLYFLSSNKNHQYNFSV